MKGGLSRQRATRIGAGLLLVALTVAAYLPAARGGFIWDDEDYVQNNQTLRSFGGLMQIWFDPGATRQYYPMVHTSFWLEYRMWELWPAGYHVVNILLHGAAAVLLWRVLTALRAPGAWWAAAVFALHPVQVESVAWITERKNVLSGVFYLGAALVYFRYASGASSEGGGAKRVVLYLVSLGLFACALLSKTVTCTLPAALLLVLWWKRGRIAWADARPLAPFFVLGIALGLVTVVMEKFKVGAFGEEWDLSFIERCLVAGRVVCFYAAKLVWPLHLAFIYPRWQIDAHVWWQYLFPAAVALVVIGLWLVRKRLGRGPLVAVLFFIGTLFPALGFFDVYPMRFSYVADHFQYLACAGLIALAAAVAVSMTRLLDVWGRRTAAVFGAALLAALGALTSYQTRIYRDLETLWRDTLDKNPDAWMAYNNLGVVLQDQGRRDEAIWHYRQAIRIKPDHTKAHYNLGAALALRRDFTDATVELSRATSLDPDFFAAHLELGKVSISLERYEEAVVHLRRAIDIKPRHASAHRYLGIALTSAGQTWEALPHFREAIGNDPTELRSLTSFAWLLATHPDGRDRERAAAVRLAELAVELSERRDARALDALGAAYAATGRFDRALTAARAAYWFAVTEDVGVASQINARVQLYEQGQPYVTPRASR